MATFPTAAREVRQRVASAGWEVRSVDEPAITVEGEPGPPVVVVTAAREGRLGRVTAAAVSDAPRWLAGIYGGPHAVARTFENASLWVSVIDGGAARRWLERLDAALDNLGFAQAVAALERDGWAVGSGGESYDSPGWETRAEKEGEHMLVSASFLSVGDPFAGTRMSRGRARRCRGEHAEIAMTIHSTPIAEALLERLCEA